MTQGDEEGTRYGIYDDVRLTYDGPLSLATNNMVWNITWDKITERTAVTTIVPCRATGFMPRWMQAGEQQMILQPQSTLNTQKVLLRIKHHIEYFCAIRVVCS